MKHLKIDGHEVIIGQSAKENDEVINIGKHSNFKCWWAHLENMPSAHLIIFTDNVKPYRQQIKDLILNSTRKAPCSQHIIYTEIQNVHKTKDLGKVVTSNTIRY